MLLALSSTGCLIDDLVGAKGVDNNNDCETRFTRRLRVEPKDASLKLKLESCRIDIDACPALCNLALLRVGEPGGVSESCNVNFTDSSAILYVTYAKDNGQCAFADDLAAGGPR